MRTIEIKLYQQLEKRRQNSGLRQLAHYDDLIDFTSNDYLGLAHSSELKENIKRDYYGTQSFKNGSTGSRLLSGNSPLASQLEIFLAKKFHADKALLYNSGYNANLALLSTVPGKGDTILYDELIHASLKDGARLSLAKKFSFRHNDLEDLKAKLLRAEGNKFVVIESIYSMDGDMASVDKIIQICKENGAELIIDEAHSTGVIGENGEGLTCNLGLQSEVFARIYTFGKAMGTHGACIVGSEILIDYLINYSRSFIYTTALPDHALVSIRCAFEYLNMHPELQSLLKRNIKTYAHLADHHIPDAFRIFSKSAIQVIKVPGNERAIALASEIRKMGFDVRPILSPTVKEGSERIRICIHAHNTEKEIEGLVRAFTF